MHQQSIGLNLRAKARGFLGRVKRVALFTTLASGLLIVIGGTRSSAAGEASVESRERNELTGQAWVDMDYGPFKTQTLEVAPGNFANKAIAIRLDPGEGGISSGNEFVIFETDTLRYAAGWTGPDFQDWNNITLNGRHGVYAKILGHTVFNNPDAPGWGDSSGGFEDTRIIGRDERRYGPMDRSVAHWKGLYLHGDQVVLSYTVGDTQVLELPGAEGPKSNRAMTRTLNIGPRSRDLILQVAHQEDNPALLRPLDDSRSPNGQIAVFLDRGKLPSTTAGRNSELRFGGSMYLDVARSDKIDFTNSNFTISARIKTRSGGTILSKAPAKGEWTENGKSFYVREGKLVYDVGFVNEVESTLSVDDGEWHIVMMTYKHETGLVSFFVDNQAAGQGTLKPTGPVDDHIVRIGYTTSDFPEEASHFTGSMADVRVYNRVVNVRQTGRRRRRRRSRSNLGLVARWNMGAVSNYTVQDISDNDHHARLVGVDNLPGQNSVSVAAVVGGPEGTEWIATPDGHLRLRIPAGNDPIRMKLVLAQVAKATDVEPFAELVQATAEAIDLAALTQGGPSRWGEKLGTKLGHLGGTDGPYVIDEITTPMENPYHSWMRLGGFDYFKDPSRAAVCTWMGDVWLVDGLGGELGEFTWQRIATGMYELLGVKVVDDVIYVVGRDQITRLHDFNGDGEADFYENFNNDAQASEHFHEFAMALQTDAAGDFYYVKAGGHDIEARFPFHGTLLKVSKDGKTTEIVATGFRAPNGLTINPDGSFMTSDQEGHWTPKNRINWVEPGGFYGYMISYDGITNRTYSEATPPVLWIHNEFDMSPSEQVWITSDKWGPLKGGLVNLSYGTGQISHIMMEKVGKVRQAGIVRIPLNEFPTGVMRGRFHPDDGQLYVCGLFGWSSRKTKPGGFYRIRYTGKPLYLPKELHATRQGMVITFTDPLDPKTATDPDLYAVGRWNYVAARRYGSPDFKVSNPQEEGRDEVRVTGVTLSPDSKTVLLHIPDMQPSMQMEIKYNIKAADGTPMSQWIENTIHVVGENEPLANRR